MLHAAVAGPWVSEEGTRRESFAEDTYLGVILQPGPHKAREADGAVAYDTCTSDCYPGFRMLANRPAVR